MRSTRRIWFARMTLLAVVVMLFVWPLVSLAIVLAWLVHMVGAATYYQVYQGRSLERALGFKHGKLYLRAGRAMHSALAIRTVVVGGPFASAGFQQDTVLPDWSFTDFFRHLHHNRGRAVEFEVVDRDVEGPPFRERPRSTLFVSVPTLAEAGPTRADCLEAISHAYVVASMPIGVAVGSLVAMAILPGGQLWAQFIIGYLSCSLFVGLGIHAVSSRPDKQLDSGK